MNQSTTDEMYMRRCLQLAVCGRRNASPNPMVGAVIVARGRIIGEGYHVRCGEGHAEVNAFASVAPDDERLLPEATMYVSLEPCAHYGKTPPCADLIVRKGVRRVVVGCVDTFAKVSGRGIEKLRASGIDVTVGVLESECRSLNRVFFTFNSLRRPFVTLKWAQSADGYIDDRFRQAAFSTPFTRMLVHKLRARHDAILIGSVTDRRDNARLNVRHWAGKDPLRIVIDRERRSFRGSTSAVLLFRSCSKSFGGAACSRFWWREERSPTARSSHQGCGTRYVWRRHPSRPAAGQRLRSCPQTSS